MKHKGFTLIELLVVIAIIGFIASLITVSFSGQRQKAKIAKALEFNQSLHNALGSEAVGVWDFDEGSGTTARDGSGHGNNGTINGAVYDCTDTPYHVVGQGSGKCALSFDGNDYVHISDSETLDLSNGKFTEAVWIYPTITDNNFHGFIGYQPPGGVTSRYPGMWVYQRYKIHAGFGDGSSWNSFVTGNVLTENAWNFVVATFDGTYYKVYVNGKEVYSTNMYAGKKPYPTKQVDIGRVDNYFNGFIDEVRIYNTALSIGEVQKLYAEGAARHQIAEK